MRFCGACVIAFPLLTAFSFRGLTKVYSRIKQKEPNSKDVVTVEHQGVKYRGVILEPSEGMAIGVIELSTMASRGGKINIIYDSSDEQYRKGQMKTAWQNVQGSSAFAVSKKQVLKEDGTPDTSRDDSAPS